MHAPQQSFLHLGRHSAQQPPPACGVQVQQVWAGELFDERSFSQPSRVTLGPLGTFVLPPLAGHTSAAALLEPFQGGFGLRLDAGDGWLELDGIRHTFAELRSILAPLAHAPVVRLGAGAKAEVCWGAFCFEIAAVDLPEHDHEPLHWRHALPLVISLAVATASTVSPLLLGLSMPGDRAQWRDQVVEPLKVREVWPVETAVPPAPVPVPTDVPIQRESPGPAESPPLEPLPRRAYPSHPRVAEPPQPGPTKGEVHKTVEDVLGRIGLPKPAEQGGTLRLGTPDPAQPASGTADVPHDGPRTGPDFGDDDAKEQEYRPGRETVEPRRVVLAVKPPTQHVIPPKVVQVLGDGLSAAEVRAVLREHHGMFKRCYQLGVQQDPDLQGRLVLSLVISAQGDVLDSRAVDSDLSESGVDACVASAAKSLHFPPSRDGQPTRVRYPLVMRGN